MSPNDSTVTGTSKFPNTACDSELQKQRAEAISQERRRSPYQEENDAGVFGTKPTIKFNQSVDFNRMQKKKDLPAVWTMSDSWEALHMEKSAAAAAS